MVTTIDGVSNIDFSGSLLGVSISGQTLNMNTNFSVSGQTLNVNGSVSGQSINFIQASQFTGELRYGELSGGFTDASGGVQLPDVPCRQYISFATSVTNGNAFFGTTSSPPYFDPITGINHTIAFGSDLAMKVGNLNRFRVMSNPGHSGSFMSWTALD